MPSPASIDEFGDIFGSIDLPLWVLTSSHGGARSGLICTFVSQASLAPQLPRVAVGLSREHFTTRLLGQSGEFALHLFDESRLDWVTHFGLQSGRDVDKLEDIAVDRGVTSAPLLAESICALDCRVEARLDIGDRLLFVAELLEATRFGSQQPLTRSRMLQLAPPEMLSELKAAMQRDSAIDAQRIARWRGRG